LENDTFGLFGLCSFGILWGEKNTQTTENVKDE